MMTDTAGALHRVRPRDARNERRGRGEIALASALSAGAAAIHLAAGAGHVESLGDLGLGFYWAAVLQAALAVALLRRSMSVGLAWAGIGLNVALIVAWAWSRLAGLPGIAGNPEAVGVVDGTAVLLELALVGLLVARARDIRTGPIVGRRTGDPTSIANAGFAVLVGLVLVSTSLAVAAARTHGGHDDAAHDLVSFEPTRDAAGDHGASTAH